MENKINLIEVQIKDYVESIRPPVELRDRLDIGYKFEQNPLELFEIRPKWDDESQIMHIAFAKAKYVKTQHVWKIYWMRANEKWVAYDPKPDVVTIMDVFDVLRNDKTGCFFG